MISTSDPSIGGVASFAENLSLEELAQLGLVDTVVEQETTEVEEQAEGVVAKNGNGHSLTPFPKPIPVLTPFPKIPPIGLPTIPFPKFPLRYVSGRYRSSGGYYQLELRVDVDGDHALKRVSGDFYQINGATTSYFGSFTVNAPTVTFSPSQAKIEGLGSFTWAAGAPYVRVTIPRRMILFPPAAATLQFFSANGGSGASYLASFESRYFRTVQWEEDSVTGSVPFTSYNTGSLPLPAGTVAETLSIPAAYAKAGIEMQLAGVSNVISTPPGTDNRWSDSELHAAMQSNFSLWANVPEWKVYLLVASEHEDAGTRGIMFDYSGTFQRQGCAVFYNAIAGATPDIQRAQLRTYVHELGHCFNLLHSWQKNLANPPAPLGPNSGFGDLSWMNYAWKYAPVPPALGGEAAYWANFPFQFTDNEIVHLRHAFRNNIIMGGNDFGTGAAEIDPQTFADQIEDHSGLALRLEVPKTYVYGEPVVVELKLSTTDTRGKKVHPYLHPKYTFVQIAIKQPGGKTLVYRPLIQRCADENATTQLDSQHLAIYDSAYIGYGRDGFYFDQPGVYQLRAIYTALDGSQVVSETVSLRVRSPYSAADEDVADLFMGAEQGKLLYLLGSDSAFLNGGNAAFDAVLDKYPKHDLAVYAKMVKGINAARDFKCLTAEKTLEVRAAKPQESVKQLTSVVKDSDGTGGVDNITLNMVMRQMARTQAKAGDKEKADQTLNQMVSLFQKKNLKPQVMKQIEAQVQSEKAAQSSL